jgi:hypothetical protein
VTGWDVLAPFFVMFTLNVTFLLAWTLTDPLRWVRIETDEFNSYGICKPQGRTWIIFLSLIIVVNSCALLLANVEAYRARSISDEFSESKYIGFAMVSMLQALLLGLPLAVLVTNNPAARLFTYSGIIVLISMSLLLLIFVPKMIIVVQDNKDKKARSGETISTGGSTGMRINMSGVINPGCPADSNKATQFYAQASSMASVPSISESLDLQEELPEQDT